MQLYHIGLVSQTKKISASELQLVAAALQKQVTRDFGPIWHVQATIDAFAQLSDVPLGYWPVIIQDKIDDPTAAGYHDDDHHQPYALVQYSRTWSLTASHEVLEMLCDPFGNRLVTANSIKKGQGRVRYLVEVCDPSEDDVFAYSVNGILVSDFYTPNYFDPVTAPGVRYSFTGSIKRPMQILKGGYLSWLNPSDGEWYQATFFGTKQSIRKLSEMKSMTGSLRSRIDRLTPLALLTEGSKNKKVLDRAKAVEQFTTRAAREQGNHLSKQIMKMMKKG